MSLASRRLPARATLVAIRAPRGLAR